MTNDVMPGERGGQGPLDGALVLAVQVCGRFVEHHHAGSLQQQPCDRQPLLLTAGQPVPAIAHHRVEPVRQAAQQTGDLGVLCVAQICCSLASGAAYRRLARIVSWNMCASCVTYPTVCRKGVQRDVSHIHVIEQNRTGVHVVESRHQCRSWSCPPHWARPRATRPPAGISKSTPCRIWSLLRASSTATDSSEARTPRQQPGSGSRRRGSGH